MKWAIREAVNVYFKAKSTFKLGARTIRSGEPVLIFDTVQTGTLEVSSEVAYVTGGMGNSRILSFEGDKVLSFTFDEALLSNEGLAILSGADMIPARNKHLEGASPEARSVIAHYTYQYSVATNNAIDGRWGAIASGTETTLEDNEPLQVDPDNTYPDDASLYPTTGPGDGRYPARGGVLNVWVDEKPYVGQNAEIYVMLLDDYGEMSGAPVQINLDNVGPISLVNPTDPSSDTTVNEAYANKKTYLAKFVTQQYFIAFDRNHNPMAVSNASTTPSLPTNAKQWPHPRSVYENGAFDDQVVYYVDITNLVTTMPTSYTAGVSVGAVANQDTWVSSWGNINSYIRKITAGTYQDGYSTVSPAGAPGTNDYAYLLAPSGGIAQPVAFKEGTSYVYKINVPSVLYQDIVLVDYYKEYKHNATQVSILPDKFAPYMYVEGSSLVRRASDGVDLPVEFVIPKLKITTALTFTLASTGDPSTFSFAGDAYPDYSKFDLTRKVLADIQILDADDNAADAVDTGDPTSYRRFAYNDADGEYLWKDPSIEAHQNINYADAYDYTVTQADNQNTVYAPDIGGAESVTPGDGVIDTNP